MSLTLQIALTVLVLCVPAHIVGLVNASPYPRIVEWGDYVAMASAFIGFFAALVGVLAFIWWF